MCYLCPFTLLLGKSAMWCVWCQRGLIKFMCGMSYFINSYISFNCHWASKCFEIFYFFKGNRLEERTFDVDIWRLNLSYNMNRGPWEWENLNFIFGCLCLNLCYKIYRHESIHCINSDHWISSKTSTWMRTVHFCLIIFQHVPCLC